MDQMDQSTGAESLNNETSTESVASESPAAPEGSGIGAHIAKVQSGKQASPESALDPVEEIQEYVPNYKFKAADKEHEFDEFIRAAIKSADDEKKIREIYEKAYGLDHVKGERDRFRNEYKAVNDQFTAINKGLDTLSAMLNNKDYHGFMQALKIPEQDILQYALSRVEYKELPPEQRQQIDQQNEQMQRLAYLEKANEELTQGYQSQVVQQRTFELDSYIGRPDIAQVASAFDARVGRPGAFRDEVIQRGQYYASLRGEDITVEQAVQEVMSLVGNISQAEVTPDQSQPGPESTQAMGHQTPKPVIPNIKARGTSPTKKVVNSMEDLKNLAKSFPG